MPQQLIATQGAAADEAARLMTICNACRYCEGYCAVFPAMTAHRTFDPATLDYLANLCHQCTACYHACQYKPPHAFNVNLPPVFSRLRLETYGRFAWPGAAARLFTANGVFAVGITAVTVVVLAAVMVMATPAGALSRAYTEPGAFYAVMPHGVMVGIAGAIFGFALISLCISSVRFARHCGIDLRMAAQPATWRRTLHAIATLRYLGGGQGEGCNIADDAFSNRRRWCHQLTAWGFVLCFLATCAAAFYELVLGRLSPFPFWSLPVLLGSFGGIGLLVGPAGLLALKRNAHPTALPADGTGMDTALLVQLMLISATGLLLLVLRETVAMPWLLIIHLGLVFAFFLTLPYGKFVHGFYRTVALLRFSAGNTVRP